MAQAVVVQQPSNGLAVAGLVCGIIGVVFGVIPFTFWLAWILGVLAIVFGAVGRRKADREPAAGRRGMGTAGLVLGIIAVVFGIIGVIILSQVIDDVRSCLDDPYQTRCN